MGTNYYWISDPCVTCQHSRERLHIGKSSWGWCFGLHVIPELGANSYEAWKKKWRSDGKIVNEYGESVTTTEMEAIITEREHDVLRKKEWMLMGYLNEADFHRNNHSERGPKGLLRHAISQDGRHCIGHGAGTWDYIVGEFS